MKLSLRLKIACVLLCCSLAPAQEPSSAAAAKVPFAGATVFDFKGKVGIQIPSHALTSPVRGEVLPPETTINTDDGRLLLRLSDGSDVVVRPHSRLVLKQPENNGWRYLQLLLGKIHTEIQKHLGGTPPVKIGTPSAVISVRGTKFDVEIDRREVTEVDVEEGAVELDSANGHGEGVIITAGFSSRVGMESGPEAPRPTRDLRPELERPGHTKERDLDDDDKEGSIKKLEAADREHRDEADREANEPSAQEPEPDRGQEPEPPRVM